MKPGTVLKPTPTAHPGENRPQGQAQGVEGWPERLGWVEYLEADGPEEGAEYARMAACSKRKRGVPCR